MHNAARFLHCSSSIDLSRVIDVSNMTPSLAASITKLGMVRFAVSQQMTFSGGDVRVSGTVELSAFMHEELVRPAAPPAPPARRREAPVSSESVLAPRDRSPVVTAPRVRPPTLLGMPWRWL